MGAGVGAGVGEGVGEGAGDLLFSYFLVLAFWWIGGFYFQPAAFYL